MDVCNLQFFVAEQVSGVVAAVRAGCLELVVPTLLLLEVVDAEVADVVVATLAHQHQVEISQADRAVVLEPIPFPRCVWQEVRHTDVLKLVIRDH